MSTADPIRSAALEQLERMRPAAEAGDSKAVFGALWLIARDHAPEWLQRAFFPGWQRILDSDSMSYDEEFGRPWPDNTQRGSVREMREARGAAHAAVWRLMQANPSRPIDDGLFEEAALLVIDESGKNPSGSTVRRRYREAVKWDGFADVRVLRS